MAQEQLFADEYKVNLDVFEGPLDLLLYLIRREELDIYDIPIERITTEYMKFIEDARRLNLDIAGEFIVMASDGVWDELENEVVVDIVGEALARGHTVDSAANLVVEACLSHAASGDVGRG